ncbi:MAG TPA: hypothetical protein VHS58_18790 [Acetobacteraceae bacterium]|jgi:hypothetical protein|nr:hypothetical protein [Acetobacteraceae bacterium]
MQHDVDPVGIPCPLSGAALLAAWERGSAAPPPDRPLALLHAAGLAETEAAALPLAARDLALLSLHTRGFGATLISFAACEACGDRLEFTLPADAVAATLRAAEPACTLAHEGGTLRLRMATARDVADAAAATDLDAARRLLLARCAEATDTALPADLRDAALARLEAMHETAEISLALACPACGARLAIQFDIASFLWAEIRHAARRLLDEVHELAWAYGWPEDAILAMSAARRLAYLHRVRG